MDKGLFRARVNLEALSLSQERQGLGRPSTHTDELIG